MKKSRFTETQIIAILKEADAGVMVKDICRKHGISDATYYNWKRIRSEALERDGAGGFPTQADVCRYGS